MPETPGAQLANAIGLLLRRSSRARIYRDLTDGLDEAVDQATYPVISALARFGAGTAAQLAGDIGIDRSVVSRHADRLEARGLVRRDPDPSDRRATLLSLTDGGSRQVAIMRARLHGALDDYLATWPADEARAFVDGFVRFVDEGPLGGVSDESAARPREPAAAGSSG